MDDNNADAVEGQFWHAGVIELHGLVAGRYIPAEAVHEKELAAGVHCVVDPVLLCLTYPALQQKEQFPTATYCAFAGKAGGAQETQADNCVPCPPAH